MNLSRKVVSFIFLSSLLFFRCQKSDSPVSSLEEPVFGKYTGFLYGIVGEDTVIARSATITVDQSKQYHADSSGRFIIDSVAEGRHLLSISHHDFFPFDTTLDTGDSAEVFVRMRSKLRDCLPLNIGNRWNYVYRMLKGSRVDGHFDNVDATFTWEVISLSQEGSGKMWKVAEVCDSMRRQCVGLPSYHTDTTYGQSSGFFYFAEAIDHRITIASGDGNVHVKHLPAELGMQAFYRYSLPDSVTGRVLMFRGWEWQPYISIAKADSGIVYHAWVPYEGNNFWDYTLWLTSCSLQP